MRGLWTDLIFGVRTGIKTPVATVAIIATLALAIAATGVAFSLVNTVLVRPLPVRQPDRLVRIYSSFASGFQYFTVSYPDCADLRDLRSVFSGVVTEEPMPVSIGVSGTYERVWGELVSGEYFSVLGLSPALGRLFDPTHENAADDRPVVVIGHGLWQRRFGGSREVLGQAIVLNGRPFSIIGVAPKGFHGTNLGLLPDVWLEKTIRPGETARSRGARAAFVVGRLQPGVGIEDTRATLDVLARRLQQTYPDTNRGIRFTALPESEGRVHPMARGGVLGLSGALAGAAALGLLLACANVAGALLVRAAARRREVGVRLALGATRGRIARQFLTEGVVLAVVAGGIGLALACAVARVLSAIRIPIARGAPLAFDIAIDGRMLAFSVLVTALTVVGFGLAPALEASRVNLVAALKDAGGGVRAGLRRLRLRDALVAVQIALSMLLLVGAGLFLRSLQNAHGVDLGFDPSGVVLTSVDLTPCGYKPDESRQFWRRLVARLAGLPRAESVSLADRAPLELNITTMAIAPEGYHPPADGGWPMVEFAVVDAGYFRTLHMTLVAGRDFGNQDTDVSVPVVIVNDVLARRFWPGTSSAGKHVTTRTGARYEVVGVARQAKYLSFGEEPKAYVYLPLNQREMGAMTAVVRGSGDPVTFLQEVRDTVRAMDDTVPIYNVATLPDHVKVALLPARAGAVVLNLVGLVALLLTSLGLYGTVAYSVSRRTQEIGVRRALGAQRIDVVWLIGKQVAVLAAIGVVTGLAAGAAGAQFLRSLLYGVTAIDPFVFSVTPIVLVLVCVAASWAPTWRALRIDAAGALRHE